MFSPFLSRVKYWFNGERNAALATVSIKETSIAKCNSVGDMLVCHKPPMAPTDSSNKGRRTCAAAMNGDGRHKDTGGVIYHHCKWVPNDNWLPPERAII